MVSATGGRQPRGQENGSRTPGTVRPYFAALLDSMPLPTFMYGPGGDGPVVASSARFLVTRTADGAERVLASDGTDLWTIIAARSDEAAPLLDIHVRLMGANGEPVEVTLAVTPVRAPGGALGGAVVQALVIPGERLRSAVTGHESRSRGGFSDMLAGLGTLTGAAVTYVLEVDRDFSSEARVIAWWAADGSPSPMKSFDLKGAPSDSFNGRRLVCIPSGLQDAYPDDRFISQGGYESYVGVALADPAGEEVGVLGGMWHRSLDDVPGTCAAFTIVAIRAAHTLANIASQRELRESEQRYGSVFEGSSMPILVIEPESTQVVDANPAACAFYGYTRDEFMTMSILQVDALAAENLQGEVRRALDGARGTFGGRHLLSGGRVRDVEVSMGPIMVAGRTLLYAMINDVTERKRMEAELEGNRRNLEHIVGQRTEDLLRANAELQQASMARDMVFVNLTQDMRTSLQTITGFSDLLLEGMAGDLTDEQRRQLEMIQQAGRRMAASTASLIETHRAEEAGPANELEQVDIVALVESVLFGLATFAEEKGLRLGFSAGERPLLVETDRYKLQQILLNLLSNAIRYTERGGVKVDVSRASDDRFAIAVSDTGPGMRHEQIESIFDGPETHRSSAGIGLPTSQRTAAALGGTIAVTSTPGVGSVFTLTMPGAAPLGHGAADREESPDA